MQGTNTCIIHLSAGSSFSCAEQYFVKAEKIKNPPCGGFCRYYPAIITSYLIKYLLLFYDLECLRLFTEFHLHEVHSRRIAGKTVQSINTGS